MRFVEPDGSLIFDKKYDIVVDVREPDTIKRQIKQKFGDVQFKQLVYGDIVINGSVCIERKTPEDFVASVSDGRLTRQMIGMVSNYDVSIVMVTGTIGGLFLKHIRRGLNENALMGKLVSLNVHGVQVLFIGNHFLWYLDRLVDYMSNKKVVRRNIKKMSGDNRIAMVASISKVGESKARLLLEKYNTVMNTLMHVDEWKEIKGIGDKIIENAKNVLYSPFKND